MPPPLHSNPENLGSGGLLPAELGGRVCRFFLFFCPLRYDARHRKPRRCVYTLNLGTGIRKEYTYGTPCIVYAPRMKVIQTWVFRRCTLPQSPPDSFSYHSNFRFRFSFRSRSSSSSTTSGDIFYCSGSRQLNHSSCLCVLINQCTEFKGKLS